MEWLGERGFGAIMTCRRDRLPNGPKKEHFHYKKTNTDLRTKVARFFEPVVAVKTTDKFERVHVSFQSTSSCNLTTVNAINSCKSFKRIKKRGKGENQRVWAIESNHARQFYLHTYCKIDNIDHLIANCKLFYRSWKYWHSPVLHGKAMAIVVAYDIYKEIAEGGLNEAWAIEEKKRITFWQFRDRLSMQLLLYKASKCSYPGDSKMREVTKRSIRKRGRPSSNKEHDDRSRRTSTGEEDSDDDSGSGPVGTTS